MIIIYLNASRTYISYNTRPFINLYNITYLYFGSFFPNFLCAIIRILFGSLSPKPLSGEISITNLSPTLAVESASSTPLRTHPSPIDTRRGSYFLTGSYKFEFLASSCLVVSKISLLSLILAVSQ